MLPACLWIPASEKGTDTGEVDTDTDTDTDTDADADIQISEIAPTYGITTGGDAVTIAGGPFDGRHVVVRYSGSAWFLFADPPTSFEYWHFFSDTIDTCASNYTYTGDLYVLVPGPAVTANLAIPTGGAIGFSWSSTDASYENTSITAAELVEDASYDLAAIQPDGYPSFEVPAIVETVGAFTLTVPAISGATPPTINRTAFDLRWSGTSGDVIVVVLYLYDAGGSSVVETVTCALIDDGSFTVPATIFGSWASDRRLDLLIGSYPSPPGTLPFNHAESQFVGMYYLYGAGFTR